MINYNMLMYSIFDRSFCVSFGGQDWNVNYTEGDLFELNKKLYLAETKYPIIWLQSGYKVKDVRGKSLELSGCRFFLITKGDPHDLYKKRYETNYQEMLFPLYQKFKDTFRKTKGIEYANPDIDFVTLPFNDVTELTSRDGQYGRKRPPEGKTVSDIWDALVIDGLNIKINADCFPQFKI